MGKDTFFEKKLSLNCQGKIINLSAPKIMGILNVSPDSFYDGGKYKNEKEIIKGIESMLNEGADFIDIGAISSRPSAKTINENEEWARLQLPLGIIKNKFSGYIFSLDTFRSNIAKKAVFDYGISIINDISSGDFDKKMHSTISQLNVPYIMMHMQGNSENMQNNPVYKHVVNDIIQYFAQKIEKLKLLGINDIIIDPGFGFGKTIEHNYQLLNALDDFKVFELPLLAGFSRKSMIYKTLNINPEQALNGTTVLNTIALLKNVNILRVHDVKEAKEAINLVQKLNIDINKYINLYLYS